MLDGGNGLIVIATIVDHSLNLAANVLFICHFNGKVKQSLIFVRADRESVCKDHSYMADPGLNSYPFRSALLYFRIASLASCQTIPMFGSIRVTKAEQVWQMRSAEKSASS